MTQELLFILYGLFSFTLGAWLMSRPKDVDVHDLANMVADLTNTNVTTVHKILKPTLKILGFRGRVM